MPDVDPRPSSDDLRLAGQLDDLFAMAKGGRKAPAPGAEAPSRAPAHAAGQGTIPPPPQPGPPAPARDADGPVLPEVEVVRLVRYLDSQLELTRRESRESAEALLGVLELLEVRLARIEGRAEKGEAPVSAAQMQELVDWLQEYSTWEAGELHRISSLVADLARLVSDSVRLGEL